jgi:hypothetical protein
VKSGWAGERREHGAKLLRGLAEGARKLRVKRAEHE